MAFDALVEIDAIEAKDAQLPITVGIHIESRQYSVGNKSYEWGVAEFCSVARVGQRISKVGD